MKIKSSLKSIKKRDLNSKLVRRRGRVYIINKTNPFSKENFELFHVSDFTEQNNLINDFPNIFDSLYVEWNDFVLRNKVLLPTPYIDDLN